MTLIPPGGMPPHHPAALQARLNEARAAWLAFCGAATTDEHFAAVDRINAALGVSDA